jgi:DNA helicase-2/ATP-dependent DNA helicase PcrA
MEGGVLALKLEDMNYEKHKLSDTIHWIEGELAKIEIEDGNLKSNIDEIRKGTRGRYSDELDTKEKLYEITHKNFEKYKEARNQPYFGRIDFREYRRDVESFYIGKFGLGDFIEGEEKVIDWRAPIADLYYSGTYGDVYYVAPQGIISGELSLKRKYLIKDGILIDAFDEGINEIILNRGNIEGNALVDEFLRINLEESTSSKLKDVVSTIQKEQNEVIRADKNKPLILQGSAGSGKTTVALHRLAYLLYKYKGKFGGEDILVLAPNKLFLDYISEVLPDLGIDNVKQCTFEDLACEVAGIKEKLISKDKKLAEIMELEVSGEKGNGEKKLMISCSKFKGTLAFKAILDRYLNLLEIEDMQVENIKVCDYILFESGEIKRLYSKDMVNLPLNHRKVEIKRYLSLKKNEKIKSIQDKIDFTYGYLVAREKKLTEDSTERRRRLTELYDERDKKKKDIVTAAKISFEGYFSDWMHHGVQGMYFELFSDKEIFEKVTEKKVPAKLSEYILKELRKNIKSGIMDSDDLSAILYLKLKIDGVPDKYKYKHIAMDEAQDYSTLQFSILKDMSVNNSMTIVGDIGQGIYYYKGVKNFENVISSVFNGDSNYVVLSQSYRSTVEIINFANIVLRKQTNNLKPAMQVLRHGKPPEVTEYKNGAEFAGLINKIVSEVESLNKKSIAIIGRTYSECKKISEIMKKCSQDKWELVKESDKKIKLDRIIIPSYMTKGLEFDCTVVYNCNTENYKDSELDKKILYVVLTRALHLEYVFYKGEKSKLLEC